MIINEMKFHLIFEISNEPFNYFCNWVWKSFSSIFYYSRKLLSRCLPPRKKEILFFNFLYVFQDSKIHINAKLFPEGDMLINYSPVWKFKNSVSIKCELSLKRVHRNRVEKENRRCEWSERIRGM